MRSKSLTDPVPSRALTPGIHLHPAGAAEGALLGGGFGSPLHGDRSGAGDRRGVEWERVGRSDVGLAESAEQDAKHGVGVGVLCRLAFPGDES